MKTNLRYYTLYFLLMFAYFSVTATINVQGIVLDSDSGAPIEDAIITLQPNGKITRSDALGGFSFVNLPIEKYTIEVKHLGYADAMIDPSSQNILQISLKKMAIALSNLVVNANPNKQFSAIAALDIRTRPINSSQDMLRMVPGLFISQHAGGGKAEQLFLRGFDIDHGTDVRIEVDGIPVNMPSHAHGQGYADLHFVIPELVQKIDFNKGSYRADMGDFATAGDVALSTYKKLNSNIVKAEIGQFDTRRTMAAIQILDTKKQNTNQTAYVAGEYVCSNNYFVAPQDFKRLNVFGKYQLLANDNQSLTLTASTFSSSWNASGQIPERAVASGKITRFGAIDDTEGGKTGRNNLNLQHLIHVKDLFIKNQLFYSQYDFDLFSNFTFFLKDSINGDMIRQREKRNLLGYKGSVAFDKNVAGLIVKSEFGADARLDWTRNSELTHVAQRYTVTKPLKLGNIQEQQLGIFASETVQFTQKFNLNIGLRGDIFSFGYADKLGVHTTLIKENSLIFSPKAALNYKKSEITSFYLRAGQGFHSNDARIVTANDGKINLPKSTQFDLGTIFKPFPNLLLNVALWQLHLQQEFVYVGDEGIVEPSGATLRRGAEVSARYQMSEGLFADLDVTYAHARSLETKDGENYIPLAPKITGTGGISANLKNGWGGALRFRYLSDRAANEDASLTAKGYCILDANVSYDWKKIGFQLSAQNVLNQNWYEAQFATTSRLKNESVPVTEIHFTPGTPFFLKGAVTYKF
jgi:outer membrane receptor protein involved in Fe transport